MNKMVLFVTLVVLGVFGVLFFSNQNFSFNTTDQRQIIPSIAPDLTFPPNNQQNQQIVNQNVTPTSQTTPPVLNASISATIKTNKGDVVLTLYGKGAPYTVDNFIKKAKSGYYNNLIFHRVEDWVVQGGDPKGDGTGGGNMPTELNDRPFIAGSLGVARKNDIKVSNDSQFFITKAESSHLNNLYTNFGIVTKGMDVVEKIEIGDKILGIKIE